MPLELYATRACPYCAEVREELEWQGREFVEYDVEADRAAHGRMLRLTDGNPLVPVLTENGRVLEIGLRGRGCYVAPVQRPSE